MAPPVIQHTPSKSILLNHPVLSLLHMYPMHNLQHVYSFPSHFSFPNPTLCVSVFRKKQLSHNELKQRWISIFVQNYTCFNCICAHSEGFNFKFSCGSRSNMGLLNQVHLHSSIHCKTFNVCIMLSLMAYLISLCCIHQWHYGKRFLLVIIPEYRSTFYMF